MDITNIMQAHPDSSLSKFERSQRCTFTLYHLFHKTIVFFCLNYKIFYFTNVKQKETLELDHLSLTFLVSAQLEMLATLDWRLFTEFAFCAFHTQHNLFGCFCLKKKFTKFNICCCIECLIRLPSF